MKRTWQYLNTSLWALSVEASSVIALRAFRFATGTLDGGAEANLMVVEKIDAASALCTKALRGELGFSPLSIAAASVQHYRRRVRANQRRLLP